MGKERKKKHELTLNTKAFHINLRPLFKREVDAIAFATGSMVDTTGPLSWCCAEKARGCQHNALSLRSLLIISSGAQFAIQLVSYIPFQPLTARLGGSTEKISIGKQFLAENIYIISQSHLSCVIITSTSPICTTTKHSLITVWF